MPSYQGKCKQFKGGVAPIFVDVQGGFMPPHKTKGGLDLPAGGLPVTNANQIMASVLLIASWAWCAITSQDWHPPTHASFAENHLDADGKPKAPFSKGGVSWESPSGKDSGPGWPRHCVQHTDEAKVHPDLAAKLSEMKIQVISVFKGLLEFVESFGAFGSQNFNSEKPDERTELMAKVAQLGIHTFVISGIALDYCVFFTLQQARSLGIQCYLVKNACAAVDQTPEGLAATYAKMEALGAILVEDPENLPEELFEEVEGSEHLEDKSSSSALAENEVAVCAAAGGGAATTGQ